MKEPGSVAREEGIDRERAFVVLRSAQRALLRAEDEAELLDLICRIAVDEAGYPLAWVGFAEDDPERTVRRAAQAGHAAGYLGSLKVSWADVPLGRGPGGVAIRTGRPVVGRNFLTDPELAPWREQAILGGFASCLALPLRADGRTFGVLAIYATAPDAFTREDVELLTGLASDLAFGVTMLRTRAARRAAEERLRQSEHDLAEAQRIARIGSWTLDPVTGDATWSSEMYRILGLDPDGPAVALADISRLFSPDSVTLVTEAVERAILTGEPWQLDLELARQDGKPGWVASRGIAERDGTGAVVRIRGTMQDITEHVAAEAERTRLVSAVQQTADAIIITDREGGIEYVNPAFERITGYSRAEAIGRNPRLLSSGSHDTAFFAAMWQTLLEGRTWASDLVNRRRDGRLYTDEAVISPVRDDSGRVRGYVSTARDVTHERALEARQVRQARERALIADALEALQPLDTAEQTAVAICRRVVELPEVAMASLLLLEPDGDAIPLALAVDDGRALERKSLGTERSAQLRTRASLGPWVEAWQPRAGHPYLAEHLAIGLRGQAYAPVRSGKVLIGLLTVGSRSPDAVELLTERLPAILEFALLAGALLAPSAAQTAATAATAATRASIRTILEAGAFRPFFQPIVELHSGAVVGYEALSRFTDGSRPDVVFAAATRVGMEVELEFATLEAALEAAAALPPQAYLSLNASPALIGSGRLGSLLAGLERRITLEVTEHAVVSDYEQLRRDLAALGPTVSLAVDDAGAGYASLRHVLELAPSLVKLDLGLVRGIDADPARQALIAGMGYFAVKRKVRLVAEGIETAAELETLRSLAIRYGQGYLLGRPQDGRGPGPWPTKVEMSQT